MEIQRRKKRDSYIDIAPLVDVVFLLLLFFMLSFQIAVEPAIKVRLPQSKTADAQSAEEVVLSISREGGIYVDELPVTLEQVASILQGKLQGETKPSIKLKADREASVGLLVKLVDEVRLAGCSTFSIVAEKE